MTVFELFGTIAINNRDANQSLDDTASKAERSGKRIQTAFKNIGAVSLKIGKAIVTGAAAIGTAWAATIEGTRDYRASMAQLDTVFVTNGHSSEAATRTYRELQSVLGDTGPAVEAASHIALMCDNEQDLYKWTDICIGAYATFGDSLPIEGLMEACNETAKTGVVTGTLADALNWAGISEDEFNLKLAACNSEGERAQLIMDTLFWTYKGASDQFKVTGADIMKANAAQEKLNSAFAMLGAIGEPILSGLKSWVAGMVTAAVPYLETFITKLSNIDETMRSELWPLLQQTFALHLGVELPDWNTFKADVSVWWANTKTDLQNFCTWTLKIFNEPHAAVEDVEAAVKGWWMNTAIPALMKVSTWTLQLFGHPVEGEAAIIDHVRAWWNTISHVVSDACTWTLKLFGMPEEGAEKIAELVKSWFDPIAEFLFEQCEWAIDLAQLPEVQEMVANIKAWWEDVKSSLGDLVLGVILDMPTVSAGFTMQQNAINQAKSEAGPWGGLAYDSFMANSDNFYSGALNTLSDMIWGNADGSHASGLERVPRDGWLARVHKDEAILNKAEADIWRGGGSERIESLLAQMVNLLASGQVIKLDSGVMVGQLAPGMDAQLGTISGYKGRGN